MLCISFALRRPSLVPLFSLALGVQTISKRNKKSMLIAVDHNQASQAWTAASSGTRCSYQSPNRPPSVRESVTEAESASGTHQQR